MPIRIYATSDFGTCQTSHSWVFNRLIEWSSITYSLVELMGQKYGHDTDVLPKFKLSKILRS